MSKPSDNLRIFFGEFRHGIDQKKRVTIPARWRSDEVDEFFIIPNVKHPSLVVLPQDVFQRMGEESKAVLATPREQRLFTTHFYSRAQNCSIDKQGRLLLSDELCKHAALDGELALVGGSDRFEIWNPKNWEARKQTEQSTFEELAERMGL